MFTRTFLILWIALCPFAVATAADCKGLLKELGPAAMKATFEQFDQTDLGGWRVLQKNGCFAEAVQLIEYYSVEVDSRYRQLKWHLAQAYATAGDTEKAIAAAKLALSPVQEEMHPDFDWNDYVLATIAFLERDRAVFDKYRARLNEAAARNATNVPNRVIIDNLAKCFEKAYAQAYGCAAP